jgi:hypothetical protein
MLVDQWQPMELYPVARGIAWKVREVLDGWTHPGWPGRTCKKPVVESGTGCGRLARCRGGRTSSRSS